MTARRFLVSATLLAVATGAAPAAEVIGGFVDMRLSGGLTAGNYDVSVHAPNGGYQGKDSGNFDENYRFTLGWVGSLGLRSYGGWIWGIGGSYNSHKGGKARYVHKTGTTSKDDLGVSAWAVDGFIGYAVPVTENFQLELLPFVGVGRAYLETPDVHHNNEAADGYLETGVDVNAVFILRNGFEFGATAGMMYWEASIKNDGTAGTLAESQRMKFAQWDGHALIFIGVRL